MNNRAKQIIFTLSLAGTAFAGCNSEHQTEEEPVQAINLSHMDSTVRLQDDFFLAVNGNWIKQTDIPADQGRWGSFNELREFNNEAVLKVLEKAGLVVVARKGRASYLGERSVVHIDPGASSAALVLRAAAQTLG